MYLLHVCTTYMYTHDATHSSCSWIHPYLVVFPFHISFYFHQNFHTCSSKYWSHPKIHPVTTPCPLLLFSCTQLPTVRHSVEVFKKYVLQLRQFACVTKTNLSGANKSTTYGCSITYMIHSHAFGSYTCSAYTCLFVTFLITCTYYFSD